MRNALLSIVIPAYNEERFIGTVLKRIDAVDLTPLGVTKEIIVVDDGSHDRTFDIATATGVRVHRLPVNGGKGRAVRAGLALATGDLLIIQDADLEYDPNDYVPMIRAFQAGRGDVVYGSRYLTRARYRHQSLTAYLGGRSLSLIAWLFTGHYLSDTVTGYKLFQRGALAALPLESPGFELDHELTARLLARGHRIVEVPISYHPRSRAEGKKIRPADWLTAVRTLARFRKG